MLKLFGADRGLRFVFLRRVEVAAINIRSMFSILVRHVGLMNKSLYRRWLRYMNAAIRAALRCPSEVLLGEAQAFDFVFCGELRVESIKV